MRRINKEEYKKYFEDEHVEDQNMFEHLIAEAQCVGALEFFGITFDETTKAFEVSDEFDVQEALEVVSDYLTFQEDLSDWNEAEASDRVNAYNSHTEPRRGADDGTFDYAGTYVISILSIIKACLTKL